MVLLKVRLAHIEVSSPGIRRHGLRSFKIRQPFRVALRLHQERTEKVDCARILWIRRNRLLQLLLSLFVLLQADVYLTQFAVSAGEPRVRLQYSQVGLLGFMELRRIVVGLAKKKI